MQPSLTLPDGGSVDAINVLILKRSPYESTVRFEHISRRTHDPRERLNEALKELSATYYQRPYEFAEVMTALFALESLVADKLIAHGECELVFEQFSQRYDLPCSVRALDADDAEFRATYSHNRMFNPSLPGTVRVVAFAPDWERGNANPPV